MNNCPNCPNNVNNGFSQYLNMNGPQMFQQFPDTSFLGHHQPLQQQQQQQRMQTYPQIMQQFPRFWYKN